ncbi:MAG TPA: DinB family protein [Candidatus Dormibacteraeota bacterium]|nr:DinB family protein [Candidatus Dormibacteraeota bacterium]
MLVAACEDEPADPDGRWRAKDQLAHLAWWRARSARVLEAARTGGDPPPRPAGDTDEVQNAAIYAETKDLPAADVKRSAEDSWSALEAALEASGEADLAKPHPHEAGAQVWEVVPGMGGHLGVHLMFWFMDGGDSVRAEAAARWGYEFECGLLPEGEKRADASYNLACFFARVGRVDEAVPLLRESFRFRPALVEWARQDPDLAGIRDHPDLAPLLAG